METLGYYDSTLTYCERNTCENHFRETRTHCPLYNKNILSNERCPMHVRIQKTHDFDLDEPLIPRSAHYSGGYLTLIRHPMDAILSRYRTDLEHNYVTGTKQNFRQYFVQALKYYYDFSVKYVMPSQHVSTVQQFRYYHSTEDRHEFVYTTYEDITTDAHSLLSAMKFLSPGPLHAFLDIKREEIFSFARVSQYDVPDYYSESFCKREIAKYNFSHIRRSDGSALIDIYR